MTELFGNSFSRDPDAHPERVEAFLVDLNGVCRGRWLVGDGVERAYSGGLRLPLSTTAVDIFGQDVPASGLIVESGDQDGEGRAVHREPRPMPWVDDGSHQLQVSLYDEDRPFECDPRHVLARVVDAAAERGLRAVVGTELEFFLFDATSAERSELSRPTTLLGSNVLSTDMLHAVRPYLDEVASACRTLSIPVEGVTCEAGPSQLEVDLGPLDDPLRAADAVVGFRRVARGFARNHGWSASFMPKPLGDHEGSGMHVHMSLIDQQGKNVFATTDGEDRLGHAIGGCLAHLAESQLFFAPNANSYRRHVADAHAPTMASWGRDNRFAALRVPRSSPEARRLEHRMPGSDTNPYLAIAAILAAALDGLDRGTDPGRPAIGAADADPRFPAPALNWRQAIDMFDDSEWVGKAFGESLKRVFVAIKRQEFDRMLARIPRAELEAYLDAP
ncbi:MAG: glutamine synthetase family protein [Myxococcota bacterium]